MRTHISYTRARKTLPFTVSLCLHHTSSDSPVTFVKQEDSKCTRNRPMPSTKSTCSRTKYCPGWGNYGKCPPRGCGEPEIKVPGIWRCIQGDNNGPEYPVDDSLCIEKTQGVVCNFGRCRGPKPYTKITCGRTGECYWKKKAGKCPITTACGRSIVPDTYTCSGGYDSKCKAPKPSSNTACANNGACTWSEKPVECPTTCGQPKAQLANTFNCEDQTCQPGLVIVCVCVFFGRRLSSCIRLFIYYQCIHPPHKRNYNISSSQFCHINSARSHACNDRDFNSAVEDIPSSYFGTSGHEL